MLLEFADEKALVSFVTQAKLPEWQRKLFKRYADAIQVHSQGQVFYKIDRLFPNEHPDSKAHRILAFESITEGSFGRAANNVNRIFKNSSYTVEASEKTLEVLAADSFDGKNFYNWFLDEWVRWSLKEDANAHFVVYPPEYAEQNNILPISFIASEHIRYMGDQAFIFISEEESEKDYTLEETRVYNETFYDQSIDRINVRLASENTYSPKIVCKINRAVYHCFLYGLGFYRIEQTNDANKYEVEFFPIKQDFIPASDVGGEKGKLEVNKSFLHPFVAFGNLALLQHSQHTAVNFTFSFPRMSEIETPCEAHGCQEGYIDCDESEEFPEGRRPCAVCKGRGRTTAQSPYKVYKKLYDPQGMEGENKHLEVPDVQFYTPDTAILDYSKKEWKDYLEQAETAVYISQRVKTGNVEAAKSKEIDRDDLFAFLSRVGQVFFGKMRFAVQCFENYYVANPTRVNVNNPFSYAILSEGEAFEALQTMLTSQVPILLKANQVESFINKFVSLSSPIRKFLEVLKFIDPLLYYSDSQLTGYKVSGVITGEQMAVHVFAYPTLQKMYTQDKALFLDDAKVIADKLLKELEGFKPKAPSDIKNTLINGNAQ